MRDYVDITTPLDGPYRVVLPLQERTEGCPECGMVFEPGKAYGYVCPNLNCPIQPKVT